MVENDNRNAQFFRLYHGCQRRIFTYLMLLVHNHSDAEDLLQETVTTLWENFDNYKEEMSFAAWAVGIARNKALTLLRSKRQSRPYLGEEFYDNVVKFADAQPAESGGRAQALEHCIKKLSLSKNQLIMLRFKENLPMKKISQLTGKSSNALYKQMSRIYGILNDCVNKTIKRSEPA
jgi:RNA polymerase sigma-70 factor, ECF subfamily